MLKNIIQFEHVVAGKIIHLLCEADTQVVYLKEALSQFMGHCVNVENAAKAQQEAAQEKPAEESSEQPVEAEHVS